MIPSVPCAAMNLMDNLTRFLDDTFGMLNPEALVSQSRLETTFVFATIWAFGSALAVGDDGTDYKKEFSDWFKRSFQGVTWPAKGMVFDYWLDPESCTFKPWLESPVYKEIQFDSKTTTMSSVTVPTGESSSVSFWMDMLLKQREPVMLAGPAGTGKTALVQGQLRTLDPTVRTSATVSMNFYTDGMAMQVSLAALDGLRRRLCPVVSPAAPSRSPVRAGPARAPPREAIGDHVRAAQLGRPRVLH